MKKFMIIAAITLVLAVMLTSCENVFDALKGVQTDGAQTDGAWENENEDGGYYETDYEDGGYTVPDVPKPDYQSTLMDRIPFTVDIGPGWEYRDLTVNGEFRRIAVQFEMESSVIPLDPCYTYYYVDIHGDNLGAEVVATGRAFLDEFMTDYVRTAYNPEEFGSVQFELFEYDFRASTFKGSDKEYIVFSIPANWEPDTATLVIATDKGKLLADAVIDKSYKVTLQGDGAERYADYEGYTNFFAFDENSITYLKVSQTVDGVTYLAEYALTVDSDTVTSAQTGRTFTTTDAVPDLADPSVY
ncbi:MAG: hypothetical protein K6D98_04775 [Clostridiales bacterium]|nr:hypothetical protein [Clostridiales bacterium]